MRSRLLSLFLACVLSGTALLNAAEQRGQVNFAGLPLPGATVTITQGDKSLTAVADAQGVYTFADVPDGKWNLKVEMLCFSAINEEVVFSAGLPGPIWDMKLLPLSEIQAQAGPAAAPPPPAVQLTTQNNPAKPAAKGKKGAPAATPQSGFKRADVTASAAPPAGSAPAPASGAFGNQSSEDLSQKASDGFLINGSSNNGASSPFALSNAFGNGRRGRSLYNGGLGLIFDNSALDARAYSITGQDTSKPQYNHLQGTVNIGGPLKIPHFIRNGPIFFVGYQWTHNRNASTATALVPTLDQRNAVNNAQAAALLSYYPLPNFTGAGYNYQTALLGLLNQDALQVRMNKNIGNKNQVSGSYAFQKTSNANPSIFLAGARNFTDNTSTLGQNLDLNWNHRFNQRTFVHFDYTFSRLGNTILPFFSGKTNVSGAAGIIGNLQDPLNYGPPTLNFSSGIQSLTDAQYAALHNETNSFAVDGFWNRSPHNFTWGGGLKRQQFNALNQSNPRGSLTFIGTGGTDFAHFATGIPDTTAIAYGNPDKYFRSNLWDGFVNDDWRVGPGLTLNLGVRWEYQSPISEKYNRLVNLSVAPGFTSVTQVLGSNPGQYPNTLLRPDKTAFQPRLAFSWRPFPASSMVVRGGYGMYYNTSVYQQIAQQLGQQPPLSKSFAIANPGLPLSTAFNAVVPSTALNTFAVDPDFRVGYTHNWQLSIQRDLPGGLVMTATYAGIKGTRAIQEFLPNTYPTGVTNPCPSCPSGFIYMTSNGNSTRESGEFQLRRRLHNGLTATVDYTYSHSIDDAALGGKAQGTAVIAQNWLNLSGERGPSIFDQRHLVAFTAQYTTGMGIGGGTLLDGWRGRLIKEWTIGTQLNAGTGLPLTPTVIAAVTGTGVTGPIRPNYTGQPIYTSGSGAYLNAAAFTPSVGQWGNAGRDSITGPPVFTMTGSLSRTFRLTDRYNLDLRVDSINPINHVTFPSYITVVNSPQFGLPIAANPMRSVQTTIRVRF